jgi:uncharacterized protein involved in outer membrane biogenesis
MRLNKRLSLIFKSLLVLVATLVVIVGIFDFIDISFTSEKARQVLLEQIITITNRDARIDGEVQITVSLLPQVLVDRIHIKNVEGFGDNDFITVSEVRVVIALLPLLTGSLKLEELAADHASVSLIQKKIGSNNWSFDHLIQAQDTTIKEAEGDVKKGSKASRLSLGVFKLTDISIKYKDESNERVLENHFERMMVDLEDKTKPKAEISGAVQGSPYDIAFESDAVDKLGSGEAWKVQGTGNIAGRKTTANAIIQFNNNVIDGIVDVDVKNINLGLMLEQLGIISGQDAKSKELNIKAKFLGKDVKEIYQKIEIELNLGRGYWKLDSLKEDQTKDLLFNNVALFTSWNKPVELHIDGSVAGEVVKISFKTNRLKEFFDELEKLGIDLEAHVAGSDISTKGTLDLPIKTKLFQLDISLKGKDLEKLNRILNSELPSFNNYSLTGKISANAKGFIVRADDATIGDTHFKTVIVIDTSSFKPFWTINLTSRQLQIKDFETDDWKVEQLNTAGKKDSTNENNGGSKEELGWMLKKIVDDPKMHFDFNLKVEKVLAGESALGRASLRVKLRDDALILEDADIDVPGGNIKSAASFKVQNNEVSGALKLDIDKFDYGAVVHYFKPDSLQGGVISARIDLLLGGKNFARLFDHATGKLDVSLWPRNSKSKIFDLWATNLLLVILPEIRKKESRVNCLVALLDLDDGILKEDFFGIDTTKVWMHGNINVNFTKEHVSLSLYPRSKTARLFAVQAPIRAEGNFGDISLMTNPVDLTAAYVSFITSPLHVPARWVFADKAPEDASEICEQLYDREYVRELKNKLINEEQKEIDEWLDSD